MVRGPLVLELTHLDLTSGGGIFSDNRVLQYNLTEAKLNNVDDR